ncbi:hypothetical protein AADZ86_13495 [Colwelliaceae bacterium BS250]
MQITLNKFLLKNIKALFHSTKREFKLESQFGSWLVDHYQDILTINKANNTIGMDIVAKRRLYVELCKDFDEVLLNCEPEDLDRLQMSNLYSNEKLAGINPNDYFVLLKTINTPLTCIDSHLNLVNGFAVRAPIEQIDNHLIKQLVVVENQIVFDNIHKAKLPIELQQAVFIYRGHDHLATGCYQLLRQLSTLNAKGEVSIIAFCDFDPAGLQIALTLPNCNKLIVPNLNEELLAKNSVNDFLQQHSNMEFLNNTQNNAIAEIFDNIKNNKLSIKQEHMLAQDNELKLLSLS